MLLALPPVLGVVPDRPDLDVLGDDPAVPRRALGLALLLNANLRFQSLARTLALVPWAMPPVIIAIMWRLMLNPNSGPVNKRHPGVRRLEGTTNWLGDFKTALPAVIVVGVWAGMPQTTIVLLAGLQSVPEELHEAAAIDGAGAAAVLARHPAGAAAGHRRDHDARLDLELQLVRPRLRADRRRTGRQDDAADAVRLQRGVPLRKPRGLAAAMGNVMVIVIAVFLLLYLRGQARSRRPE